MPASPAATRREPDTLLGLAQALAPTLADSGVGPEALEGLPAYLAARPPTPQAAIGPLLPPQSKEPMPPPLLLVGMDPPAALAKAADECVPRSSGFVPRLLVVEPNAHAALAALADLALRRGADAVLDLLHAGNTHWMLGPGAHDRLAAYFAHHPHDHLPTGLHAAPGPGPMAAAKRAAAIVADAADAQQRELRALLERLQQLQHTAHTAARLRDGSALRLLIITTRFSTYMRHAARDLAGALREAGHDATVLVEPDASTRMTRLSYAAAIADTPPDAIVLINYLRAQLGPIVPPSLPVVTWVQDAMPHLLAPGQGLRAQRNDFVAGLYYPELRTRLGFAPQRTLRHANPVSPTTFHDAPADRQQYAHLACDIAMATRHSQTPERFARDMAEGFGRGTPMARAADTIADGVGPLVDRAAERGVLITERLDTLTSDALRDALGATPSPEQLAVLRASLTLPLADLIYRQQAAAWAAAVAQRHGLRFHLYGPGWEDHPTLAPWARPELSHGEELRAAYNLAGVTIHASARVIAHQRLAEVAFSGGLPLVRRTTEDLDRSRSYLLHELLQDATPDACPLATRTAGFTIADHPKAMALAARYGRLGERLGVDGVLAPSPAELEGIASTEPDMLLTTKDDPNALLVDLAQTTFATEEELEQRVLAAMDRGVRRGLSRAIAARCRRKFGMDHFARALVALITGR